MAQPAAGPEACGVSRRECSRCECLKQGLLGAATPLPFPSYPVPPFGQPAVQEAEKLVPRDPTPGLPAKLFSFDPSLYRFTADEDCFFVEVERSEEHTAELQSLAYLLCRLLL